MTESKTPRMDRVVCGCSFGPVVQQIADEGCKLETELAKAQADLYQTQTQLGAWQRTFGTSQLSHAQARLDAAERAQADLGEALDALIACRRELSYIIKQMEVPKGGSVWAARERADDVVKKHGRIK
jgi:hypothetical protein